MNLIKKNYSILAQNRRHKAKMRSLEIHKEIKLEQLDQIHSYNSPAELPIEIQHEIRSEIFLTELITLNDF